MDEPNRSDPNLTRGLAALRIWLRNLFRIHDIATPQETIDGIKKDIVFKGFNVWILIAAIVIASIGLNVNSAAVVIGAMLISPLMGPILGVGLSVGTNDIVLLRTAAKNLGIAVGVSILTATIYFFITPFPDAQSEILARTRPTLLDALIAFFGGAAGILAGSRREKSNVVPGVAIATALMPPLCTAGYGLAQGNLAFFLGAFYLFLINTVFISLSTVIFVRYLDFPKASWVDARKEAGYKRLTWFLLMIFLVPAGWFLYTGAMESYFLRKANSFVNEICQHEGSILLKSDLTYDSPTSEIRLVFVGKEVDELEVQKWQKKLPQYNLEDTRLLVLQGSDRGDEADDPAIHQQYIGLIQASNLKLSSTERAVDSLNRVIQGYQLRDFHLKQLGEELKVQEPRLEGISMGYLYFTDFNKTDSIPTVQFNWKRGTPAAVRKTESEKMARWLKVRLNLDTIQQASR